MPLRPGVRTALTLGVLAVVVLLALVWGAARLTAPVPGLGADDPPTCVDRKVAKGAAVEPTQVVVSVYNAGNRQGQAVRTLNALEKRGFSPGKVDNAPGTVRVRTVQIWAADPSGPAARLVAAQFGADVAIRAPQIASYADQGVVVMVGNQGALAAGPKAVRATAAATVCGPVPA